MSLLQIIRQYKNYPKIISILLPFTHSSDNRFLGISPWILQGKIFLDPHILLWKIPYHMLFSAGSLQLWIFFFFFAAIAEYSLDFKVAKNNSNFASFRYFGAKSERRKFASFRYFVAKSERRNFASYRLRLFCLRYEITKWHKSATILWLICAIP